jgi:hypothetical protein
MRQTQTPKGNASDHLPAARNIAVEEHRSIAIAKTIESSTIHYSFGNTTRIIACPKNHVRMKREIRRHRSNM